MRDAPHSRMHRRLIDSLYVESMLLADEARGYFDEAGRADRESLDALSRVLFSCESMKVTTRLMHVIAWLLTQRAVAETGGQLFFFDAAGELVEVRGLDPDGVIRYRVHFDDYAEVAAVGEEAGGRFPKRVTLESPANASEARFQWKRVRFVAELADEVFRLPALGRPAAGS